MIETELRSQIRQTITELSKLESIERHFQSLVDQELTMIKDRDALEKGLVKELKDVEKLEKGGVKSMFYNILGSKGQQIEKERQEYLQLSLKHSEHLKSLKLLKYEKEVMQSKMGNIKLLKEKLVTLKEARKTEIITSSGPARDKLYNLLAQEEEALHIQGLLDRCRDKGQAAYMSLQRVIQYFKKAKEWGNWDMMANKRRSGHYYKSRKHGAIDAAVSEANRSNMLLKSFVHDINNLGYDMEKVSLGYESFSNFMNVLFDNLISDWIVQAKIKKALSNTENTRDRVASMVKSLENESSTLTEKVNQLNKEKDQLLEA